MTRRFSSALFSSAQFSPVHFGSDLLIYKYTLVFIGFAASIWYRLFGKRDEIELLENKSDVIKCTGGFTCVGYYLHAFRPFIGMTYLAHLLTTLHLWERLELSQGNCGHAQT